MQPTRHSFRSTRLELAWWEWGVVEAPLLLLIHGGRDHGRSWQDLAVRFASDWRVVAPDLRGHGTSAWADGGGYQIEDFVYDLARLADVLGISVEHPVTIVGHSLGGNVALRWTGLYPELVRRLVVIEGLGSSPARQAEEDATPIATRLRGWIDARARREERGLPVYPDLAAATARMRQAHPGFGEDLARRLSGQGVIPADGGVRFAHDPLLLAWSVVELSQARKAELWAAITCPVLLAYGRESWASNPAEDGRAGCFRNAEVRLFDRAGHWLHHDRSDEFAEVVRAFITQ